MSQDRPFRPEAVTIAPSGGAWRWSVAAPGTTVLSGEASSEVSALKTGRFAAGAIDSLFRANRRSV